MYTGRRSRGQTLTEPVTVDTSSLWHRDDVGVMLTPAGGDRRATLDKWPCLFATDTGCFAHPERFDVASYLDWLDTLRPYLPRCLFATAPDLVGDAEATWEKSEMVLPLIREAGFPAALVAQDGLERMPVAWHMFDCLFIGGTTAWKLSEAAYGLIAEAKRYGKWVHCGRINSMRRLRAMQMAGADSADGTCLAYNPPQYIREIADWLDRLRVQPPMRLFA